MFIQRKLWKKIFHGHTYACAYAAYYACICSILHNIMHNIFFLLIIFLCMHAHACMRPSLAYNSLHNTILLCTHTCPKDLWGGMIQKNGLKFEGEERIFTEWILIGWIDRYLKHCKEWQILIGRIINIHIMMSIPNTS
jgi:UDP-N-acetylmuramyl pentapeptide phosphotransferase/UDP-N-acetylglucosamine-1-phosphate transferase